MSYSYQPLNNNDYTNGVNVRHRHNDYDNTTHDNNRRNNSSTSIASRISRSIRSVDIYHKTDTDYTIQHNAGGIISLCMIFIISILILSELYNYLFPPLHHQLSVEQRSQYQQHMYINFNITFPSLICNDIGIDVMDVSGEASVDTHSKSIQRVKLAANGGWIGQPYSEEQDNHDVDIALQMLQIQGQLLNSLNNANNRNKDGKQQQPGQQPGTSTQRRLLQYDLLNIPQLYEQHNNPAIDGVGCLLYGNIRVNKVGGNLHVALGGAHHHRHDSQHQPQHIHNFYPWQIAKFNASHIIHHFSFGDIYKGMFNPLDGTQSQPITNGVGHYKYLIKVIPTIYHNYNQYIDTNQYSVTNHTIVLDGDIQQQMSHAVLPGIFFMYDFTPFVIHISQHKTSLLHLFTSSFAIVGGVIAVFGIIDGIVYYIKRKMKR